MSTICAIATPPGGALGVVRVSGPEAIRATQAVFIPQGKQTLEEKAGNSLTFGRIVDPTTHEVVDEVLVSLFRAPHSYTGEDCTEISCHGSAYILHRVVELLLQQGCQMARPGEYTQRAFLNGKMDLSQAEAVADLIASTTQANHRMAMNQMRGGFSRELRALRDKLLHITA
ncbi:MAG: tRNA uridine-5-carboxymethylaminomethyl(34) synthesis GTPase MnmE, partial [Bacteroidales bacterium]|nr:tRNA uridine-5-carboxymethylaminomethyl(34) synthesis GTPase MnmE [Bacteroidales bacterium]